jgi:hypothetical protein
MLNRHLDEDRAERKPYRHFAGFLEAIDEDDVKTYWKQKLDGAKQAVFPSASKASDSPVMRNTTKVVCLPEAGGSAITKETIFRASWALALARYSETDYIAFGTTLSGRQALVLGLDMIPGATISIVPVRVAFNPDDTVSNSSSRVRTKHPR